MEEMKLPKMFIKRIYQFLSQKEAHDRGKGSMQKISTGIS